MLFFEVFDTLTVSEELRELFGDIQVVKVTISKKTGQALVYLESTHLLSRKQIRAMEFQLQKQLFQSDNHKVAIVERYVLSAQYDPGKLWDMHSESILTELMEESVMNYNILKTSQISFE
jgi:DNA polymerase-3 subunit alpha (Gram-positive type)